MAKPVSSSTAVRYFEEHWTWWFTVVVLSLIAGIRIWLMNFPLERDEGEYAYAGQLILQGVPPYELAYNMKFPGTYAAYAAIMAFFGQTPGGIHFGVMCMTTATALMLYWLGKKIRDGLSGMVAATTYAVLATESGMFGLSGHATHFGAFFATAGFCFLWNARQRNDWVRAGVAGVLFGMAILMKQHAACIGAWAAGLLAWDYFRKTEVPAPIRLRSLVAIVAGLVLPFATCCLVLWQAGVFGKFWFWTIDYGRQYASIVPFASAWNNLRWSLRQIVAENQLLWPLVVAGMGFVWWHRLLGPRRFILGGFVVAAALTTAPGFYFRTHYFLLALPAAGLLAAITVCAVDECWRYYVRHPALRKWPVAVLYVLLLGITLCRDKSFWSFAAKAQGENVLLSHFYFGQEPFPEAESIAKFIRDNSTPSAKVAVLGSEPEIYFLSQRHSATGYIYMYPLMEPQLFARQMQDDLIREIETSAPEFVVVVRLDSSWLMTPQSEKKIFQWWGGYQTNYTATALADMVSPARIRFAWGADGVKQYDRSPTNGIIVFQKKSVPPNPSPAPAPL